MDAIRRLTVGLLAMLMVGLMTGCIHEGQGDKPTAVKNETDRPVVVRRDRDATWLVGVGVALEIERPHTGDFIKEYEILDAETCMLKEIVTVDTTVAWDAMIVLPASGPATVRRIDGVPLRDRPEKTSPTPGLCAGSERQSRQTGTSPPTR